MASSKQVDAVDQRVEYACVLNSSDLTDTGTDHEINVNKAIRMAFALGVRFGVAAPYLAGDYLGRWLTDNKFEDLEPHEMGQRHEIVLRRCIWPLTIPEGEYGKEGNKG